MSKETFALKQSAIDALKPSEIQTPAIPVGIALQEANDLHIWCMADKEALTKVGLDWSLVDDLPLRISACRYIQSEWQKEYQSKEEAQRDWAVESPVGYELRNELVHHFFHAFRKNSDLMSKVTRISEGDTHADMIQDLSDLSVLGLANSDALNAINLNLDVLDQAAAMSQTLSDLLAKANGDRLTDNVMILQRNKAYSYMKQAVDEIRHHGQYVFWRNEDRKKGYVSMFAKRKNNASKKATSLVD